MKPAVAGITGFILTGLTAVAASAAEGLGGEVSLLGSFLQMLASLAVVIGIILLVSRVANRWLKNVPAAGAPRYIRLVETRHLGPKKSLMLVEVGGEYFLLGNSAEGVQLIKQVEMLEEIEVVASPEQAWNNGLGETFRRLVGKVSAAASMGRAAWGGNTAAASPMKGAASLFQPSRREQAGLQQGFVK